MSVRVIYHSKGDYAVSLNSTTRLVGASLGVTCMAVSVLDRTVAENLGSQRLVLYENV